jgi:hypothetical protein
MAIRREESVMNTWVRLCAVALALAWLPMASAQQNPPAGDDSRTKREEVEKEVEEAAEAIRNYTVERRNEAVARTSEAMAQTDRRIDRLQDQTNERWSRMSEATRQRSQAAMADIRRRRSDVAEWAGGMRHGSIEAWNEVRSGFVKSYRDLAEALRKAREQFDRETPPSKDDSATSEKQEGQR